MPKYDYACEDHHITELDLPMREKKPLEITCLTETGSSKLCAKPAKRIYSFAGFKI